MIPIKDCSYMGGNITRFSLVKGQGDIKFLRPRARSGDSLPSVGPWPARHGLADGLRNAVLVGLVVGPGIANDRCEEAAFALALAI